MDIGLWLLAPALVAWWGLLFWPARAWRYDDELVVEARSDSPSLSSVTVVIPARNEAGIIGETLARLSQQGRDLRVVLVNDQSEDDTVSVARRVAFPDLCIVDGQPLPPGWVGKLWALEQGIRRVTTPWILLLDADIALDPGVVPALLEKARLGDRDAVSVMAAPRLSSRAEKTFLPAFVYFFKLLYPFARVNNPGRKTAAAAGGCFLVRRSALAALGGFAPMRGALIDDCTLARRLKDHGYRIWLGTSHAVRSRRGQTSGAIARMVMRTAYTQLRRSPLLLLLTTAVMLECFLVPWLALLGHGLLVRALASSSLLAMTVSYFPTLRYYRRPWWEAILLAPVALAYLFWTWRSAFRDIRGTRSEWKGRRYGSLSDEIDAPLSEKSHGV